MAGAGVFVLLVAAFAVFRDAPTPAPAPPLAVVAPGAMDSDAASPPEPVVEDELVVSVVGLVTQPGLVRLQPGSRIADAVAAAGGSVEGGDLLALNMAARVADGDQIVVGVVPPQPAPLLSGTSSTQTTTPDSAVSSGSGYPGSTGGTGAAAAGGTVDLNAATVAELDALPGVGPVTATSIVSWREINGPFISVDQLAEVDGIGPGRLTKIRDLVHIG
ncbi:helix-hairpin-helix domain-containing protein [Rhodococcus sp. NPDC078407]|uniref:helix-hairpin-helix domain-containing protein n=1 Tax=Rhodococcus sp. NPDC078407 TaxID=3364509 RepID=UPI0037C770F6